MKTFRTRPGRAERVAEDPARAYVARPLAEHESSGDEGAARVMESGLRRADLSLAEAIEALGTQARTDLHGLPAGAAAAGAGAGAAFCFLDNAVPSGDRSEACVY